MADTVSAAYLAGARRIELRDIPIPTCPDDSALVRVAYTGICGSDLLMYRGNREQASAPIGHEFSGVVAAVRADASGFAVNDRVCVEAVASCGTCDTCTAGRTELCRCRRFIPQDGPGGLSQLAVVPTRSMHHLPDEVGLRDAALVETCAVGLHALAQTGSAPSDRVLIIGGGALGLATLLVAKRLGYSDVHVLARHQHQRRTAAALGARHVYAPLSVPLEESYRTVVNCVPGSPAISTALSACMRGGRVVLCGGYSTPEIAAFRRVVSLELELVGSICYSRAEFTRVISWVADGSLTPGRLISHILPFKQVQEAFEIASDKKSGAIKVVVAMAEGKTRESNLH